VNVTVPVSASVSVFVPFSMSGAVSVTIYVFVFVFVFVFMFVRVNALTKFGKHVQAMVLNVLQFANADIKLSQAVVFVSNFACQMSCKFMLALTIEGTNKPNSTS
jgi:hypothetical protein